MSAEYPILHPDIQRLMDENALLREELTRLLWEAHDLVQTTKPNLLALYQTKIGAWELRALRAQCQFARLKRQIELVRASLNRGERPDLVAIECTLELEFIAWQAKLKDAAASIAAAEFRLAHLLRPAEDRELKKLYHILAKQLHPDANPDLTDDQRLLWLRVQAAYEASDIEELRALALLAEKSCGASPAVKTMDKLRQEQILLRERIVEGLRRLELINSQPPFTLRRQLEDEDWVAARRKELELQIENLQRQSTAMDAHLEAILNEHGNGIQFGNN